MISTSCRGQAGLWAGEVCLEDEAMEVHVVVWRTWLKVYGLSAGLLVLTVPPTIRAEEGSPPPANPPQAPESEPGERPEPGPGERPEAEERPESGPSEPPDGEEAEEPHGDSGAAAPEAPPSEGDEPPSPPLSGEPESLEGLEDDEEEVGMLDPGGSPGMPAPDVEPGEAGGGEEGPSTFEAEETVVTGTRTRRGLSDSPVRTEVITAREIEDRGAVSLVDAVTERPGIRIENQCSICNTTGISISGMPSRYTLVVIDGVPMFSSLGATYGLLNIAAADIERIELIRGANSVLWGTDAIGGVVHVITRRPQRRAASILSAQAGGYGSYNLAGYGSYFRQPYGVSVVATHGHHDSIDRDDDEITEYSGYLRTTAAITGWASLGSRTDLMLRIGGAQENRQGGGIGAFIEVIDDDEGRRTMSESIISRRLEASLIATHRFHNDLRLRITGAYVFHHQDSDYEGEIYNARQHIAYLDANVAAPLHERYELVAGASVRIENLEENLSLNEYTYVMPGVYLQGDWHITDWLEFLHGLRFDYHNVYGTVPTGVTPRASFRASATDWLTFRLTGGTGFRAPTTFYEYAHGVRPEGYTLRQETDSAESSVGVSFSADLDFGRVFRGGVNLSYNRVMDPITVELVESEGGGYNEGDVLVRNVDGHLDIVSVEAEARTRPAHWFSATLGYGYSYYNDEGGALVTAPPEHHLTASVEFNLDRWWAPRLIITGEVFSPMNLASVYGPGYNLRRDAPLALESWLDPANADRDNPKRLRSPWYGTVDIRIEQRIYGGLYAYFGIDNLFDYHQADVESPLYFPADDEGNATPADVVYIWGPLRGRYIYGGLRLTL